MHKEVPNWLTLSRIAVIPALVVTFYLKGNWGFWLSAGIFLYASVTDFLDGYLARSYQAQSDFGRFLDPIADKLLVATSLLLLVHQGRADILPAIAIVGREILVSGLREFLAETRISLPVSSLGKLKTGFQMAAITLLLLGAGGPAFFPTVLTGRVCLWAAAILTLISGYAYMKQGWQHFDKK